MRLGHSLHPVRYPLDARVELRQLCVQLGEGLAGKGGQSRRRVIQKPDEGGPDLLRGLSNHQSIRGQQTPNLINDGGPVFHEERPCAVHSLQVGLFRRLDRDTAHAGPTHGFADRFRIATIILVGIDIAGHTSGASA